MMDLLTRRDILQLSLAAAIPGGLLWSGRSVAAIGGSDPNAVAFRLLDRFVAGYSAAMNAPGLTLAVASGERTLRTASYGFVERAARIPVTTDLLFEIGSITKSFAALVILQLSEERKLQLQAPILDYLPWLSMDCPLGEITVHHLLTHSSGMPEDAPVFPGSAERRPRQAFKPGSEFHYSNWGFGVIGYLIEALDGKPWPVSLTERILKPVGMSHSAAAITSAVRPRIAPSYMPLYDDRTYPRLGPLAPAGNLTVQTAAGSIASTPGDMALYMRMILNRGVVPGGRIVSEESFVLFATPHIPASEFGPTASYGYGIAVDKLDGRVRLRHTGGMVSFMSAIHMDLDSKVGAFASINAQLGYRPNPVAEYALRLMRAAMDRAPLPAMPPFDESAKVDAAPGYAGTYVAADGRRLGVEAGADRLSLVFEGRRIPLQQTEEGTFIADDLAFDRYPLVFERESRSGEGTQGAAASPPPIVALAYGADWYASSRVHGANALSPSPELVPYEGTYYSENPWNGTILVVQRQRRLWIGGTDPLFRVGNHLFRVGLQASSPELAEFSEFVGGTPRILRFDGGEFQRVDGTSA
jgi:CubicO group peptidase (beta-lactamase class C family)